MSSSHYGSGILSEGGIGVQSYGGNVVSREEMFSSSREPREDESSGRYERIYENIISEVLCSLEEEFDLGDVSEAIRPPYAEDEIRKALGYGVDQGFIAEVGDGYEKVEV
jgi:hypothetical protein